MRLWRRARGGADALHSAPVSETRLAAKKAEIERLKESATADAVLGLVELLQDDDEYVRGDAAAALGEIGDDRAVPALVAALGDREGYVVRTAVNALSRLNALAPSEPVLRPLAERLEKGLRDGEWVEVEDYAKALARLVLPDVHEDLLADFDDPYVVRGWLAARSAAAEAFERLGEAERADAVDPRRRSAELIARPVFNADEAAEVLAALFDARVPFDPDATLAWPVHAIGGRLNEQGGFDLMLEAYERFARLRPGGSPSPALQLERAWRGIGSWAG